MSKDFLNQLTKKDLSFQNELWKNVVYSTKGKEPLSLKQGHKNVLSISIPKILLTITIHTC